MRVLQLAPLCRRLRERIEEGLVSLDESVDLLVDASYLVFVKAQWLIPQSLPFEEEEVEDDWSETLRTLKTVLPFLTEKSWLELPERLKGC